MHWDFEKAMLLHSPCTFVSLVHFVRLLGSWMWIAIKEKNTEADAVGKLALSFTSLGSWRTLGRPPLKGTHHFKLVKLFPLQKMKKEMEFIHLRY